MQIHTVQNYVFVKCICPVSVCMCMYHFSMHMSMYVYVLLVCVCICLYQDVYLHKIQVHMHSSQPASKECICVCMCTYAELYCGMYVQCICMYCMYWPRLALMPAQRPQKAPCWGGDPRAPLRASLVRWPTTFFSHWGPTPGPVLAHQRAQHALGGSKVHPLRRQ